MRSLRPDLQRLDRVQLQHRSPDLSDSDQIPQCSISAHRSAVSRIGFEGTCQDAYRTRFTEKCCKLMDINE